MILLFSAVSLATTISAANVPSWTGISEDKGLRQGSQLANNFFLSTRTTEGNTWTYANPLAYPGAKWTSCQYYDWGYETEHYTPAPDLPSGYWYNPDIPKSTFDWNTRSIPYSKPSRYVSANCARGSRLGHNSEDYCHDGGSEGTYYSCCYQYDKYYNGAHLDACSTALGGGNNALCYNKHMRCCYNTSPLIDYTNFGSDCPYNIRAWTGAHSGGVKLHQAMKPDRCQTRSTQNASPDSDKTPAMFFYRDSDACLQDSTGHNFDGYTCATATSNGNDRSWCTSYARDMQRCCPQSCGTGVLTPNACARLTPNTGDCTYTYHDNGYDNDAQKCEIRINCQGSWEEWGEWSSAGCGSSQFRTKSYDVSKQPMHGGTACPSDQRETRSTDPCPVNCAGSWSEWSAYSPTCGGSQTRSRSYGVTTQPAHGGTACPTTQAESRSAPACPDPTMFPTDEPTTKSPTFEPTREPTRFPTREPTTKSPTDEPTHEPTDGPTVDSNTLRRRVADLEAHVEDLLTRVADLEAHLETGTESVTNPTLDPTDNPTMFCPRWCQASSSPWRCTFNACINCSFCT